MGARRGQPHGSGPMIDSDSVTLRGFTPPTYDLLAQMVDDAWGHPKLSHARPTVIPFEHAAALWFVLRTMPDETFPGGKWATLQHLEALVLDAAETRR
jgi:hypothetical protein